MTGATAKKDMAEAAVVNGLFRETVQDYGMTDAISPSVLSAFRATIADG